jgi:hypothetical protein
MRGDTLGEATGYLFLVSGGWFPVIEYWILNGIAVAGCSFRVAGLEDQKTSYCLIGWLFSRDRHCLDYSL